MYIIVTNQMHISASRLCSLLRTIYTMGVPGSVALYLHAEVVLVLRRRWSGNSGCNLSKTVQVLRLDRDHHGDRVGCFSAACRSGEKYGAKLKFYRHNIPLRASHPSVRQPLVSGINDSHARVGLATRERDRWFEEKMLQYSPVYSTTPQHTAHTAHTLPAEYQPFA